MIFQNFGFNQNYPVIVSGIDPDAQAFITATGISGSNATAINTLVVTLKADSLWTKMVAVYPFIGGTADTNKYNLIDPQNTNAAFRLTYVIESGAEITHSNLGFEVKNAQSAPTDRSAYAITYIAPSSTVTAGSEHISVYINSNYNQSNVDPVPIGAFNGATQLSLLVNKAGTDAGANVNKFGARMNSTTLQGNAANVQSGFFLATRNSTTLSLYRNGGTAEASGSTGGTLPTRNIFIGALNINDADYGATWTRFATVTYGDGLTYTDNVNLYNAIQTYNTSLGRQYYDSDAQSFITAAGISGSNANAINNLVIELKTTGSLWNKMDVIYPFIGGTLDSSKWNLKNINQFSASFINTPVASTTGIQFNGTNNYMDTGYSITSAVTSSLHMSYYKRTGRNTGDNIDAGAFNESTTRGVFLASQLTSTLSRARQYATAMDNSVAPYTGSFMTTADTTHSSLYKGSTEVSTISLSNPGALSTGSITLGALKRTQDQSIAYYTSGSYGFMTIGQHISGSDATNLTTIIQNYQTTLGRQV